MKQLAIFSLLHFCLIFIVTSCDKKPLGYEELENPQLIDGDPAEHDDDYISGLYQMEGTRVIISDCYVCTNPDHEADYDTMHVSFEMEIRLIKSMPDSARIISHEDTDSENYRYNHFPNEYIKISNSEIFYDVFDTGNIYRGEGHVDEGSLELNTFYKWRGYTAYDSLQGLLKQELFPILE